MKILASFLFVFFISLDVAASGYAGYRNIEVIHQRECSTDKGFEIGLASAHKNPDNCTSALDIELSCEHPAYQTMVSMILAAKLADKKLDFWLAGCGADGQAKVVTVKMQ